MRFYTQSANKYSRKNRAHGQKVQSPAHEGGGNERILPMKGIDHHPRKSQHQHEHFRIEKWHEQAHGIEVQKTPYAQKR
ncbi:hypothetical protein D3C78_602040 [compost metagenome]